MNTKRLTCGLSLASLALVGATTTVQAAKNTKPNIIFILSDDAGYADFGFQGSKQFKTPNLDKMASEGVILEQAYTSDAVSGPSRAGLMTGRYQQRFGIEENPVPGLMSANGLNTAKDMGVDIRERFTADYLKEAGYTCAIFGKWHLGAEDQFHPFRRGFDTFIGFRGGARSFHAYKPGQFKDPNHENLLEYGFRNYKEPDKYLTTLLGDEACKFVEQNKDTPFYMYLAFNAVHAPLDVDPADMKEFAHLKGKRQRLAAMALSMDRACGKLMETLKKNGLDKNTIIVFGNDNGGPNGTETSNYPLSGMKATFLEGGIRVPAFVRYPGVIKKGTRYDKPVSFLDFLPTFTTLAGVTLPEDAAIDGVDVLPYLTGKKEGRPHQTLYWKCENRGVVRDGDMKFMRFPDRPAELYDISKDEGEHNNIADKHPELIKKYYKMLFDWEMTLVRPKWMLERMCEERVMDQFYEQPEYRFPKEYK